MTYGALGAIKGAAKFLLSVIEGTMSPVLGFGFAGRRTRRCDHVGASWPDSKDGEHDEAWRTARASSAFARLGQNCSARFE